MGEMNEEDFNRMIVEVGRKIREATGLSIEESEDAARSVMGCCIETDERDLAIVRNQKGEEVTRQPLAVVLGSDQDPA